MRGERTLSVRLNDLLCARGRFYMPEDKEITPVVREWVTKAENDLKNAAHTLRMGEGCPADTVCFHAQQCVEKYLKAYLVLEGTDFPKTHDVERVWNLLPEGARPKLSLEDQRRLTAYATFMRYPGDYEPVSLTEARRAVRIARRVRTAIRKLLPKESLRRRSK